MPNQNSAPRAANSPIVRDAVGRWFSKRFVWQIPVYQRHYAWDADDATGPIHSFLETLKEQTKERLNGETPKQHYLGAVLVDADEQKTRDAALDGVWYYDVVDGQQRLTTMQLAMLALIKVANRFDCKEEIKKDLKNYIFLSNQLEDTKLKPTNFDEGQFGDVLLDALRRYSDDDQNVPKENYEKSKVWKTFEELKKQFKEMVGNAEPEKTIRAIRDSLTEGFDIVVIHLESSDDAQQIFESLNSQGKRLTTFDLIRNHIFHRAGNDAERLFNTELWQELEKPYWEEKANKIERGTKDSATHIEAYVARVLVSKQWDDSFHFNRNEIFDTYKKFSKKFRHSVESEIKELARYKDIYQYLDNHMDKKSIPPKSEFGGVEFGVFHYDKWNNREFYPVLFSIIRKDIDGGEKQRMINLLESYVVRRAVCGVTSKNYNKQVATFCKKLKDDFDYEKLNEVLTHSEAKTYVFPKKDKVLSDCVVVNFYGKCPSQLRHYIFDRIEESMHEKKAVRMKIDDLTTDHILPQKWHNNPKWRKIVLGGNDAENNAALEADTRIHTIGNLTLLSGPNNTQKSNRPLDEVKKLFSESTVMLNRNLAQEEEWNFDKITERSKTLGEKICKIWANPNDK